LARAWQEAVAAPAAREPTELGARPIGRKLLVDAGHRVGVQELPLLLHLCATQTKWRAAGTTAAFAFAFKFGSVESLVVKVHAS
jgi:hypothetical protein